MRGREREEVHEAILSSDERAYRFFAGSRLLSQWIKCGMRVAGRLDRQYLQ
jgi:hypothetical protein